MEVEMINVYIVSGFLGAGKTTLIQKMLSGMKDVMLIENEFGEVGVDASFFDNNLKVTEINNGCICCSLKGDFKDALEQIRAYKVSNLIIEPSGVGKLSDIMPVVLKEDDMRLVSHCCVVDVRTARKFHKNFKEYFDDQVIMANAVLLSHLDIANEKQVEEAIEIIKDLNDEVEINTKDVNEMNYEELLDFMVKNVNICPECLMGEECCCCHHEHEHDHHDHEHECHHEHHHHHHDDPFEAISFKTDRLYTIDEVKEMMHQLDDSIIRCKGYVLSDEGTIYFNYVLDEETIFLGNKQEEGLIVLIGTELDSNKWTEVFKIHG